MKKIAMLMITIMCLSGCTGQKLVPKIESKEEITEVTTEVTTERVYPNGNTKPVDFESIGESLKIQTQDTEEIKARKELITNIANGCIQEICGQESELEYVHNYFNNMDKDIKEVLGIGQNIYTIDDFSIDTFGADNATIICKTFDEIGNWSINTVLNGETPVIKNISRINEYNTDIFISEEDLNKTMFNGVDDYIYSAEDLIKIKLLRNYSVELINKIIDPTSNDITDISLSEYQQDDFIVNVNIVNKEGIILITKDYKYIIQIDTEIIDDKVSINNVRLESSETGFDKDIESLISKYITTVNSSLELIDTIDNTEIRYRHRQDMSLPLKDLQNIGEIQIKDLNNITVECEYKDKTIEFNCSIVDGKINTMEIQIYIPMEE